MMTKFGSVLIQLVSVDSTNNYIANLIEQGSCQDGSVIMADYQTQGRGQRGNSWQSVSTENLMFSIAIQPDYSLEEQIRLSWFSALMWQQCLLRFGLKAQIKWPNDIYVGKQKIGGILIEQQLKGIQLDWSILGCGINVNEAPELANATSIYKETAKRFKPLTVLAEYLDLLNGQQHLLNGDFAYLKTKFEAELWLKDVVQVFENRDGVVFQGMILGVNDSGEILIESDGKLLNFANQEIKYQSF
jgi:BirA family transcriptional regulator, biotin operon repressor / biotin---[acetyl-CoA-carboxylase] ligase